MTLRAITFDFWSTLVDGEITPERTAARLAHVQNALTAAGHRCTVDELQRAFEAALGRLNETTRETLEEVGPPGRWAEVAVELGIPAGLIPYEVVERAYDDLTLDPLPAAMPYAQQAVADMQRAGYRLAVICNTGMAGGRVLREVLRRHQLLDYFAATVFSNEFGRAKPHPTIFEHALAALGGVRAEEALHVGDLEELDVAGARRAGLYSARYIPDLSDQSSTAADILVRDWRTFGNQIADLDRALSQ